MFKKLILVAALLALPASALALVGSDNLAEDRKVVAWCAKLGVPADADVSAGVAGVVGATTVNSVTAPTIAVLISPPHPARLQVEMIDNGSGNTLSCTSARITGTDQFGRAVRETLTTATGTTSQITEVAPACTAAGSTNCTRAVFATVTEAIATGCTGGNNAGDLFRVSASLVLGTTVRINRQSDVESACIEDAGTGLQVHCANYDTAASTADLLGQVTTNVPRASNNTINAGSAMFGVPGSQVAAQDLDLICARVRPSR